jgi:predicted DNA-binding transcriptional regulator AlpA
MADVRVDTSDLLDATEVATVLGLSHRQAVSTYRLRYDDFPEPVVVKNSGTCTLWRRQDIVAWSKRRSRA